MGGALLLRWFGVTAVNALAVAALEKAYSTLARHAAAVAAPAAPHCVRRCGLAHSHTAHLCEPHPPPLSVTGVLLYAIDSSVLR